MSFDPYSFANLWWQYRVCRRNKRNTINQLRFEANAEVNLLDLQRWKKPEVRNLISDQNPSRGAGRSRSSQRSRRSWSKRRARSSDLSGANEPFAEP